MVEIVETFLILIKYVMTMHCCWTSDGKQIFRRLFYKSWDERYDLFDPGSSFRPSSLREEEVKCETRRWNENVKKKRVLLFE